MADSSKNAKYIIIGLVIVALLVISYFVWQSIPKKGVTKNAPTEESSPGLLSIIAGLFGYGKGSSSGGGGIKGKDVKSFACKIFPKLCEPKGTGTGAGGELNPYSCDCSNPGFDTDGNQQAGCEYNGDQFIKDCR